MSPDETFASVLVSMRRHPHDTVCAILHALKATGPQGLDALLAMVARDASIDEFVNWANASATNFAAAHTPQAPLPPGVPRTAPATRLPRYALAVALSAYVSLPCADGASPQERAGAKGDEWITQLTRAAVLALANPRAVRDALLRKMPKDELLKLCTRKCINLAHAACDGTVDTLRLLHRAAVRPRPPLVIDLTRNTPEPEPAPAPEPKPEPEPTRQRKRVLTDSPSPEPVPARSAPRRVRVQSAAAAEYAEAKAAEAERVARAAAQAHSRAERAARRA